MSINAKNVAMIIVAASGKGGTGKTIINFENSARIESWCEKNATETYKIIRRGGLLK
jgi:septum formation inhibitor-activating ATPase MinD